MVAQCRIAYASVYVDLAGYFPNDAVDQYKGKQGYLLGENGRFTIKENIKKDEIEHIKGFISRPQRNQNGRCYLVLAGMMVDTSMTDLDQNMFFFG